MSITAASAPSPLIGKSGAVVPISDNSQVANDSGTPGNIKLVSPVYDGNSHNVNAVWSTPVTISAASTNFSGNLNITYKLSKTDLTALNSEIARAKSSPSYTPGRSARSMAPPRRARHPADAGSLGTESGGSRSLRAVPHQGVAVVEAPSHPS